jgi:hypothetical protein
VHEDPGATEHVNDVFAMLPGVPCRRITLTVFTVSRENTLNCVAEQPVGTHVKTESVSVAAEFALFTE